MNNVKLTAIWLYGLMDERPTPPSIARCQNEFSVSAMTLSSYCRSPGSVRDEPARMTSYGDLAHGTGHRTGHHSADA